MIYKPPCLYTFSEENIYNIYVQYIYILTFSEENIYNIYVQYFNNDTVIQIYICGQDLDHP